MKVPLVIFRTEWKGWGVRAATSIPAGTYLCDYFGELRFEATDMEQLPQNLYESDTIATLSHIELAESSKRTARIAREIMPQTEKFLSDFEQDLRDNWDSGKTLA